MNIKLNKILIFFVIFIILLCVSFNREFTKKLEHQNLIGNNYYSENTIKLDNNLLYNESVSIIINKYNNFSIHGELDNIYRYIKIFGDIETP